MPRIPGNLQVWIDARKRFHLSHAHVQMARELGMNPKNFGKLANHDQEPWKLPLPQFIEHLYHKRFGKCRPDDVVPIEERARQLAARKATKREAKRSAEQLRTAVAWYVPEQWGKLREISADKDLLENDHRGWLLNAEKTVGKTAEAGANIERVTVDVDELEAWCRSRGCPVNGESRAQFVAHLLRRRGKVSETDHKIGNIEDDIPF